MRIRSRVALLSTIAVAAATVPIGFAVGNASAATDPHAGFTQYTDSYKLQNRTNRPAGQVFSTTNGVININVHSGEQRVEMAWSRWPNLHQDRLPDLTHSPPPTLAQ